MKRYASCLGGLLLAGLLVSCGGGGGGGDSSSSPATANGGGGASRPGRFEESDVTTVSLSPGQWTSTDNRFGWSGGSALRSTETGATASFTFSGTWVTWIGARNEDSGIAEVSVDGGPNTVIETDGERGPGYFEVEGDEGRHVLALRTLEAAPVRLFGWVAENRSGVTYESLGINGAQASLILNWNEELYDEHLRQRRGVVKGARQGRGRVPG